MNELLIVLVTIVGGLGVGVFFWSLINTRKKYYEEFLVRKNDGKD